MAILPQQAATCLKLIKTCKILMASSKPKIQMENEMIDFLNKELVMSYEGTQYYEGLQFLMEGEYQTNIEHCFKWVKISDRSEYMDKIYLKILSLIGCIKHQKSILSISDRVDPYSTRNRNINLKVEKYRSKLSSLLEAWSFQIKLGRETMKVDSTSPDKWDKATIERCLR